MRIFVLWLLLAAIPFCASAQPVPESVQRDLQRIQERELERDREREEEFRRSQESEPNGEVIAIEDDAALDGKTCVRVDNAEILGVELYDPQRFAGSLGGLTGECTPASDIDAVLREITNTYVADGYITTRAVIVAEALQESILRILVVEGTVDAIESTGTEGFRPYSKGELAFAFPGLKRGPLNLRDLEQGVDQLGRLRSAQANIDILPSTKPGASDIDVKRVRLGRSVRPFLSFDNDGFASTGRLQGTAGLEVDSPLGVGDYWSFYYSSDLEKDDIRGNRAFGGFLSIPYGYTTLSLSAGKSSYRSVLTSNGLAFASEGETTNGSVTLDRLIFRDSKTKLSVAGRLALIDTENRIQQIRLGTNSYRLVTADLDVRLQRRMGDWYVFANTTYTRGLDIFGADYIDLGPDGPRVEFNKLAANVSAQSWLTAFRVPVLYSVAVTGALGLDPLLPAERFNLGGRYTIRGFRDDGISGKSGAFVRQQVTVGLLTLFEKAGPPLRTQISLLAGHDAGGILPRKGDPFERGFLQSATLGIQLQSGNLQADITASAPISAPSTVQSSSLEFAASVRLSI